MKRIFLFIFAFTLVLSLTVISTTTVSASPTHQLQSTKTSSCYFSTVSTVNVYDQGTHTYIGNVYLFDDGCGDAYAVCNALSMYVGVINHCSASFGLYGGLGGTWTGDWGGSASIQTPEMNGAVGGLSSACGVVQAIHWNYWGQACTNYVAS